MHDTGTNRRITTINGFTLRQDSRSDHKLPIKFLHSLLLEGRASVLRANSACNASFIILLFSLFQLFGSGFMLNGSNRSPSGNMLLSLSISGTN